MKRRAFLAGLGVIVARPAWPAGVSYPAVKPGYVLVFPRDHGAHPEFRTEWWYVTGWLKTTRGEDLGFQVTF
ncbi:MAG: lipocalin-like domain-containing protein, partial [Burkholderiales bacterium]